jgi:glutaredoxin-related protein
MAQNSSEKLLKHSIYKESSMPRQVLDETHIHPAVREKVASHQSEIVREVQQAVAAHPIVVVGMKQNPFPKNARKLLDSRGLDYKYLEYGSYFGGWRRRNALKMWTGWPTMPMVFVKGVLVGGAQDLERLAANGELEAMLK